jgi:hypothetical protein
MSKRFTDTEKWKDDWYISLNNDYRIIWQWLLDNCNHAGICKRSIKLLNFMCNTNITEDKLIEEMEGRILIKNNIWFIPKFLKFQYSSLNSNKPVILSVVKELISNDLQNLIPESFGNDYIIIKQSLHNDKLIITELLPNDSLIIKDKDKDKDKDKVKDIIIKSKKFISSDFTELPEHYTISIIEQFKIQKQKTITQKQITDIWEVFKIQNLTGEEFYTSENKVYQHFINWIKKQNFENGPAKPTAEEKFNFYKNYSDRFD